MRECIAHGDTYKSIIQPNAYENWDHVVIFAIHWGVTILGEGAFKGCSLAKNFVIPYTVIIIADLVFFGCSSMTSIAIPDSVTTIGDSAFSRCTSLASIAIPDSVTTIGNRAFYGCCRLTSITIPDSVTTIGEYTFFNCRELTSFTIPLTVTDIGERAFLKCRALKIITIPDSVTNIGVSAFQYCRALKIITLPETVATIGPAAFKGCSSLNTLLVQPAVNDDGAAEVASFWNKLFEVPEEGDDFYDEDAEIVGKDQVAPLANVTQIWAPDNIIKLLTGPFKDYATLAEVPRAMRASPNATTWAAVQLYLWWSDPHDDAGQGRVLSPSRQQMVWTVMHVALRLETISTSHVFADVLPLDIWLLIMTFVKKEMY
jgi:hypothetical protein